MAFRGPLDHNQVGIPVANYPTRTQKHTTANSSSIQHTFPLTHPNTHLPPHTPTTSAMTRPPIHEWSKSSRICRPFHFRRGDVIRWEDCEHEYGEERTGEILWADNVVVYGHQLHQIEGSKVWELREMRYPLTLDKITHHISHDPVYILTTERVRQAYRLCGFDRKVGPKNLLFCRVEDEVRT